LTSTIKNRGKYPGDEDLFASGYFPVFTKAADDLCYLLTRGYGSASALELVGNRYRLNKRQREALLRISSSREEIDSRQAKVCPAADLKGQSVDIDGFNLLIVLESLLSGAFVFKCRDGSYRDISGVHGSYHRVAKTGDAIRLVEAGLKNLGVEHVCWYLDAPVSNSGRLKTLLLSANNCWWEVELLNSPDRELAQSSRIVITSDGWILDRVSRWFNLIEYLLDCQMIKGNLVVA